jgi:surface protein
MNSSLNPIDNIIKINTKKKLRDLILSGKFDDATQVKNNEHICKDGTIYYYSAVTDMSNMFFECSFLTTIPLFNTSNVVDMSYMFDGCQKLKQIPFLDLSNLEMFRYIFSNCF